MAGLEPARTYSVQRILSPIVHLSSLLLLDEYLTTSAYFRNFASLCAPLRRN